MRVGTIDDTPDIHHVTIDFTTHTATVRDPHNKLIAVLDRCTHLERRALDVLSPTHRNRFVNWADMIAAAAHNTGLHGPAGANTIKTLIDTPGKNPTLDWIIDFADAIERCEATQASILRNFAFTTLEQAAVHAPQAAAATLAGWPICANEREVLLAAAAVPEANRQRAASNRAAELDIDLVWTA